MVGSLRVDLDDLEKNQIRRDAARVYACAGRLEEARRIWEAQLIREPNCFDTHLELGKLYAKCGQRRSALREYHRLKKILSSRVMFTAGLKRRLSKRDPTEQGIACSIEMLQASAARQVAELRELITG